MQSKKLYTDQDAESMKELTGKPYRPSNGSEGYLFEYMWCSRCSKERFAKEEFCDILTNAICWDINDPQYPKEWQIDVDGQPVCTAFVEAAGKPANAEEEVRE